MIKFKKYVLLFFGLSNCMCLNKSILFHFHYASAPVIAEGGGIMLSGCPSVLQYIRLSDSRQCDISGTSLGNFYSYFAKCTWRQGWID